MIRALNCTLTASLIIAAIWLLNLPDAVMLAQVVVMGTGMYWAGAELDELRSSQ
jgi:hypothetical protein